MSHPRYVVTFTGRLDLGRGSGWDMSLQSIMPFVPHVGLGLGKHAPARVTDVRYLGSTDLHGETYHLVDCNVAVWNERSDGSVDHMMEYPAHVVQNLLRTGRTSPDQQETGLNLPWVFKTAD